MKSKFDNLGKIVGVQFNMEWLNQIHVNLTPL